MAIAIDWDVKHQLKQTQLMLFLQADLIKNVYITLWRHHDVKTARKNLEI